MWILCYPLESCPPKKGSWVLKQFRRPEAAVNPGNSGGPVLNEALVTSNGQGTVLLFRVFLEGWKATQGTVNHDKDPY